MPLFSFAKRWKRFVLHINGKPTPIRISMPECRGRVKIKLEAGGEAKWVMEKEDGGDGIKEIE